ncbi:MAG TPA: HPr family phosphocarrier protein [Mobilitalea sp.]|nr:HPr family phosphocarrier protein [Mobilitalea sp.]
MDFMISLDTFDKIKKFINISSLLHYELDLISGKYVVDGKSIMGILSLDLSNPLKVNVVDSNTYPKELEEFMI